jgi:hypothetical protein
MWELALFVEFMYENPYFTAFVSERYQDKQAVFLDEIQKNLWSIFYDGYTVDRHTAINLFTTAGSPFISQETVEVRTFKGNMKRDRILKSIEFLQALIAFVRKYSVNVKAPKNPLKWSKADMKSLPSFTAQDFKSFALEREFPNLNQFISQYKRSK